MFSISIAMHKTKDAQIASVKRQMGKVHHVKEILGDPEAVCVLYTLK